MKLREIKLNAREALKGNWGIAILASFIEGTFTAIGGGSTSSGAASEAEKIDFSQLSQLTTQEIVTAFAILGGFVLLGLFLSVVVASLVSIGYAQFNIDLVEGVQPKISTIFSKGRQVWTAIAANLLVLIRVFLGGLLFFIPGIIASYKYSMVNYVIAENPGITAREALERSKEIMRGNKFRLFRLNLSFLGWAFVVVLTLGIASLWVVPYMQASYAKFYKDIA